MRISRLTKTLIKGKGNLFCTSTSHDIHSRRSIINFIMRRAAKPSSGVAKVLMASPPFVRFGCSWNAPYPSQSLRISSFHPLRHFAMKTKKMRKRKKRLHGCKFKLKTRKAALRRYRITACGHLKGKSRRHGRHRRIVFRRRGLRGNMRHLLKLIPSRVQGRRFKLALINKDKRNRYE